MPPPAAKLNCDQQQQLVKVGFMKAIATAKSYQLSGLSLPADKSKQYLSLLRSKAQLSQQHQAQLYDGMEALRRLSLKGKASALEQFKKQYIARFEYHSIPVLAALDPDIGIDYPEHDQMERDSWSPLHGWLMKCWLQTQQPEVLQLDIKELRLVSSDQLRLPAGQATLFSVFEEKVWIRQSGGSCATSLVARMTPFDAEIAGMAKAICREEQRQSDCIFADVIYHGETVQQRVSSSVPLRAHHLVIGDPWKGLPGVLAWADLFLKMQGEELILYSKSLDKRIIPCLNNAYNYRRDHFPLFRLLCDLQQEGLDPVNAFSLASFFPGLAFYPRVEMGDIILAPASWYINMEDQAFLKGTTDEKLLRFREFASTHRLPQKFFWRTGDQGLLFDLEDDFEMALLINELKDKKELVLEEWLWDSYKSAVMDEKGNAFVHEFIAFSTAKDKRLPLLSCRCCDNFNKTEDTTWFYFKVYLQEDQQDDFLLGALQELSVSSSMQWHYLRYKDELGTHLRIRFKKNEQHTDLNCMRLAEEWRRLPICRGVIIDGYFPEMNRYQFLGMEKTHCLFNLSSFSAYEYLNTSIDERMIYGLAVAFLLFAPAYHSLSLHRKDAAGAGEWNRWFRHHKKQIVSEIDRVRQNDHFVKYLISLAADQASEEDRIFYFQSIFHLHINRLFAAEQPQREAAVFYLLDRLITLCKSLHSSRLRQ